MSGFEWFLLVIVVVLVPLIVAVAVTLWTLEQARLRKRQNRPAAAAAGPVKRKATREAAPATPAAVLETPAVEQTLDAEMSDLAMSDAAIASPGSVDLVTPEVPDADEAAVEGEAEPFVPPIGETTPGPDGADVAPTLGEKERDRP